MNFSLLFPILQSLLLFTPALAQVSKYQPCPLLGPYLPPPRIDPTSLALQSALADFTSTIDQYIKAGDGMFGPITPNITTFSLALFAGSNFVEDTHDPKPYFYEYHHTASAEPTNAADIDSVYAIGDLTQLFTVLAWLIEEGDGLWTKSIVEYVPDLLNISKEDDVIGSVDWKDVTVGALASHMAGIARSSK